MARLRGCINPTERNAKHISPSKASWGRGPNKENFEQKFTKQSKLGSGPQQREFRAEIRQAKQVGVKKAFS
ncbi:hypothetical protein HMPREF2529_11200 [Staphylococcus sp. HMSC063D03]|nr:hypothetical protein HMPREF2529_11200 [Staphylococcus sp. HMSC063D03]